MISGPSGAGKTTLLRLLVRLLDPASGQIAYEGAPLTALPVPDLRRQVQLVGQRATLQTARVRDEVRAAAPELADREVARLLADVGLDPVSFADRHTSGLWAG
ncbi:ATP-binding cassette domain-containing protein [Actinomadura sp. SCN-SB]|uniref:ATP-binding cassette domain-containing protein n=1 Tax=Actinomadura sp. SCN-SB TaxID=3373092 RepID=UPI00375327D3